MKGRYFVLVISILLTYTIIPSPTSAFPDQSEAFDFTLSNGNIVNLSQFQDKPIVLDWTASWCPLCEENQKTFRSIYNEYRDFVNFITISYSGSGDDLDDVNDIKNRGNVWTFGLDHAGYSATADAQNADIWIMDADLNIIYSWDYAIVNKADFVGKLQDVVGPITITSDGVTSSVSFSEPEDEVQLFGLNENPLFIGFLALTAGLGILTVYLKRGK